MTTLEKLGEFGLIARIQARADSLRTPEVLLGIGDDAAILRPRAGEDLLVSTDALVEDVHFRWDRQAAVTIGRRALLVNLSDLAAMGARPVGFTLALSAPPALSLKRVDGLLDGLLREAHTHACPLIGGNLSRAAKTTMAVTVLGAVPRGRALRRDAARPGDAIYVTGSLGGAGLALRNAERSGSALRHLPTPRVGVGRALARMKQAGACIDISDGFVSDLAHVLDASGVGAELEFSRIPTPPGFSARCAALGLDADAVAVHAGEDYELLFTLHGAGSGGSKRAWHAEERLGKRFGVRVTQVGRIVRERGIRGLPQTLSGSGHRHF